MAFSEYTNFTNLILKKTVSTLQPIIEEPEIEELEESALEMLIEFLTSFPVQVVVGVAAASTTMMNPSMSMTMASGAPPGNVCT